MKNKNLITKQAYKTDAAILTALVIVASLLTWFLPLSYLIAMFLFLGLPSLYLSIKNSQAVVRASIFASVMTVAGAVCDFLVLQNPPWIEPHTIFPFRLFGTVPVEDIIWAFLLAYFIVMLYEHFYDHRRHKVLGTNMKYLFILFGGSLLLTVLMAYFAWSFPVIHYFYLKSGALLLGLPTLLFLVYFHTFRARFIKIMSYLFVLNLLFEIIGLQKGYWVFLGQEFIGWVSLGNYRFPLEELIFFMIICSGAILTYLEFFDDNRVHFNRKATSRKR